MFPYQLFTYHLTLTYITDHFELKNTLVSGFDLILFDVSREKRAKSERVLIGRTV